MARLRVRWASRLCQETQYLASTLANRLAFNAFVATKLCVRKTELALGMKFISTFTKLHGLGEERWPTKVTQICISADQRKWCKYAFPLTNGSDVEYVFPRYQLNRFRGLRSTGEQLRNRRSLRATLRLRSGKQTKAVRTDQLTNSLVWGETTKTLHELHERPAQQAREFPGRRGAGAGLGDLLLLLLGGEGGGTFLLAPARTFSTLTFQTPFYHFWVIIG